MQGNARQNTLNLDQWHPPKGIYTEEKDVLDWVLLPLSEKDKSTFVQTTEPKAQGHLKTRYKSFDTSIMELADDIAYGVHDLEDAIAMSLLSPSQWESKFLAPLAQIEGNPITAKKDFYTDNLFSGSNKGRKHAISKLVGWFINHTQLTELTEFEHPLLRLQATMHPSAHDMLKLLKSDIWFQAIIGEPL